MRRYFYVRRSLMRSSPSGRELGYATRFIRENQDLVLLLVCAIFARETEGAGMAMHTHANVRDPLDVPEKDYYPDRRHGLAVAKAFIDLLPDLSNPPAEPSPPKSPQGHRERARNEEIQPSK